jgi:hypothetical protein
MGAALFLFAVGFYLPDNQLLLFFIGKFAFWLLGVNTGKELEQGFACFLALYDRNRLEQNAFAGRLRFQVISFSQAKLPPQFSGQGNLALAQNL